MCGFLHLKLAIQNIKTCHFSRAWICILLTPEFLFVASIHNLAEPSLVNAEPTLVKIKRGTSHLAAWIDTKTLRGNLTKGPCPLLHLFFLTLLGHHTLYTKYPSTPERKNSSK